MKQLEDNLVVSVRNLSVRFQTSERTVDAVTDLSFDIEKGKTLAIVGESGSGKSVTSLSLMRLVENGGGAIVNGEMLFRCCSGEVVDLAKQSNQAMRSIRGADMAMIFQEPMTSLNPVFTVGEQIAESLRLHQGMGHKQALQEALHMLDLVRLPDAKGALKRYPHQLSGGMRQRVMIAMALACRPNLLIADEPTTALDVTIQAQILQLIRELQKEMNMSVIFITHDMGVVAEVADDVLVMYRGKKVEQGKAAALFANPQHLYTQKLLAAVPRLGAMKGTDKPRRFDLLDMDEAPVVTGKKKIENHEKQGNTEPILKVRDLVTRFDIRQGVFNRVTAKVHAVEHISFDLYPGETLALVGESGCGKSTTGRSLLKLIESESGQIIFNGQEIRDVKGEQMRNLRKEIQFVFQDPYASLDPRQTVGYSIMEPMIIHHVGSAKERQARVEWLLEKVGLEPEMALRYPHEFSGGQRQRICIARAIALNPKVVIADESVSALDVSVQAQIVNLLMDLQDEFGISFLFISHDMAVVERISHRVAVMYLGQIVEVGTRREIFENPIHPYTRKLMAAVPIADPLQRKKEFKLMTEEIPSPRRQLGDNPIVEPLVKINDDHYVAKHPVGTYPALV